MSLAHDPKPENGETILGLAQAVLPSNTPRLIGDLRVEYERGGWRVKDDRGHVWRVRHDAVIDIVFEVESVP